MEGAPTIAAFRPPGERATAAEAVLEAAGATPLIDPMVEPVATGALPRADGDVVVLTSSTAADILEEATWELADARVVAIGPRTAEALEGVGITVDLVPRTFSSTGLVEALADEVEGARIEIARSDHGSDTLVEGLWDAGAYVHETVLYRLERPSGAGASVDAALDGELDGVAFTSSLTVEHFLEVAGDRGETDALLDTLDSIAVGAIGDPTAVTADERGIAVDIIASEATFETLATELVTAIQSSDTRSV